MHIGKNVVIGNQVFKRIPDIKKYCVNWDRLGYDAIKTSKSQ